jgi:16S rRNA (uracil1498-N3)-methyltransferase
MATAGDRRGPGPERAYAPDLGADEVTLDASESAHLVRSRRVRAGEVVVLFDGRGTSVTGEVLRADPRATVVAVTGSAPDRAPRRAVCVAVSLPEAGRADRMVAQLAELGVSELAPLACERTPPGRNALAARRAERWARIAIEGAKVCGASVTLAVRPVVAFDAAVTRPAVLLDPDPRAPWLSEIVATLGPETWLLIGPEGGFTDAEIDLARSARIACARAVATALRVETATVVAAAIALA